MIDAERGQRRDHGPVDSQDVAEQQRSRLRRERCVVVQEQQAETERQRQHHADGDVAVADALAQRSHRDAGGKREGRGGPTAALAPIRPAPVAPAKPICDSAWPAKVCPRMTRK